MRWGSVGAGIAVLLMLQACAVVDTAANVTGTVVSTTAEVTGDVIGAAAGTVSKSSDPDSPTR